MPGSKKKEGRKQNMEKPIKTVACVIGRSASGKTALAKAACAGLKLRMVRSYTTRPPRANELKDPERSDHYFVDKAEFRRIMAEESPVAYTEINGNEYCATEAELMASDVYVIDPEGYETLRAWAGGRHELKAVYVSTDRGRAAKRLKGRRESAAAQEARWASEDAQFTKFEDEEGYDILVPNNGTYEEGVRRMEDALRAVFGGKEEA